MEQRSRVFCEIINNLYLYSQSIPQLNLLRMMLTQHCFLFRQARAFAVCNRGVKACNRIVIPSASQQAPNTLTRVILIAYRRLDLKSPQHLTSRRLDAIHVSECHESRRIARIIGDSESFGLGVTESHGPWTRLSDTGYWAKVFGKLDLSRLTVKKIPQWLNYFV